MANITTNSDASCLDQAQSEATNRASKTEASFSNTPSVGSPSGDTCSVDAPCAHSPYAGFPLASLELLAPAGSREALHAAVSAGADAVYLGASQFNARNSADNFTLDTLREACDYAHLRQVKVYLTLNTVVLPSELPDALELARQAFRAGVDAYIVQDLGIAQEIARTLPEARLHISTQMNVHDVDGLRAVAALGAKRVTLARELSFEDLSVLAKEAQELGVELEVFGHGALCVCYSGQCFLSSLVGGRSANRGRCAQACRLPYTLHNRALRKNLPAPGEHLLSPKDLCTIDFLPELIQTGVSSLKIEGRMKSPDYVKNVVGVYRAVLDRALAYVDEMHRAEFDCGSVELPVSDTFLSPRATEEEKQVLSEAFSRGFTSAYLTKTRDNSIMSYKRPNNRGVFIGRVASVSGKNVSIACEQELSVGDALEFWTNRGHFVAEVDQLSYDKAGNARITVNRGVGKGDRVFRVRNASASFKDDEHAPRIPLYGKASLLIGKPLTLSISTKPFVASEARQSFCSASEPESACGAIGGAQLGVQSGAQSGVQSGAQSSSQSGVQPGVQSGSHPGVQSDAPSGLQRASEPGYCVTVEGALVEPARTKAVSKEEVAEHIDRMGSTSFTFADLAVELDEGVGIGFSALHKIRSQAIEELTEEVLSAYHSRSLKRTPARAKAPRIRKGSCKVGAWATNPACARAAKKAGADFIYVPVMNYRRGEAVIAGQLSATSEQAGYPKQCIPALPVVSHLFDERDRNGFDIWKRVKADKPVFVENFGQLLRASELGALPEVGPHIPVTNMLDVQLMHDCGATRIWLSPELSLVQIEELGEVSPVPLGLTIMGSQEMMVTEHCLLMSQGPCNQDCAQCPRRKSPHYLKDRKGYEMPVITDACGRSHLYNAVSLDVAHAIPDLIRAGVSALMVDTTLMNVSEVSKKVARAVRARDIALKGDNRVSKAEGATSGHLFRGVS